MVASSFSNAFAQTPVSDTPEPAVTRGQFHYPQTARTDHVDGYQGVKVPDPYHWLEDANSLQTQAWVEAENAVTFAYLRQLPSRERIKQRLTQLWDYEKYGVPFKEGGRYFYARNTGLQNQSVIFTAPTLADKPVELLDPNKFSADGTVWLGSYSVSDNGRYLAYGLNTSGSDWTEWHVREVATGKDLPEVFKMVEILGRCVDQGQHRIFLQPLRCAGREDATSGGQLLSETLFSPRRDHAGRGRSNLRAQGREGMGFPRDRHRRWEFSDHRRDPRHRSEESNLLPTAECRRRKGDGGTPP